MKIACCSGQEAVLIEAIESHPLPSIIVCDADYDRLISVAAAALGRTPEIAESLLCELERAVVVEQDVLPSIVVRLGSEVTFRSDEDTPRRVRLVLPFEANIAEGKISIMTPVGTALLGLSPGQSIPCRVREGLCRVLTVLEVTPPLGGGTSPHGRA